MTPTTDPDLIPYVRKLELLLSRPVWSCPSLRRRFHELDTELQGSLTRALATLLRDQDIVRYGARLIPISGANASTPPAASPQAGDSSAAPKASWQSWG